MKEKKDILKNLHASFINGMSAVSTKEAGEWLESKSLSVELTGACYSSGQTHHRKPQPFIDELLSIGFLSPSDAPVKSPELKAYTSFGREGIVFPLKNKQNEVVNFYSVRIKTQDQKTEYLNREGIYPGYPHSLTERVYITDNILDAATILESRILGNRDAVISLHDGFLAEEMYDAIKGLKQLQEIITISGKNDKEEKAAEMLSLLLAKTTIQRIKLPEDHSLNDMLVNYQLEGLQQLLGEANTPAEVTPQQENKAVLKQINEGRLAYETSLGTFHILGPLSQELDTLKATIHFEEIHSQRKYRDKVDLYRRNQVEQFAGVVTTAEHLDGAQLEAELLKLTDLLEKHREDNTDRYFQNKRMVNILPPEKEREAINFLSRPNLLDSIDTLIERSGIIGEENNRKLVFVIASTHKMPHTLHGLIQGTSGSGKTHLLNGIGQLMPPEDIIYATRASSKSFYHYEKDELIGKLMLIQDIDGLDEQSLYAFREMQSAGFVTSLVPIKDSFGNLRTVNKTVNAKFASLVATTHAEVYYDNLSRSIQLGVDESDLQTQAIIRHQNNERAGLVNKKEKLQAVELLQNCIRTLKPYPVVNKYANQLQLPGEAKSLRRLNNHYQEFVIQITLLNQYQRKKDEQGRLLTTVEDLRTACEIMFDAIIWKIDELDSTLRQFFEQLKTYVKKQNVSGQYRFATRELRQGFNISRSHVDRYIQDLRRLEYIQIADGSANKGYKYQIVYWDDMNKMRQKVKTELLNQINQIKE